MFRTLTAGIRFDKNKYRQEAEKFGLVKKQIENVKEEVPTKVISLENDLIPDSNLPTPDESDEDNNELQLLGNFSKTCVKLEFWQNSSKGSEIIHTAKNVNKVWRIFLVKKFGKSKWNLHLLLS